jgi:hypothetical protein
MAVDRTGQIVDLLVDGRVYRHDEANNGAWQFIDSGVRTMAVDRTGQIVDLLADGRVVRGDNGAWQFIDSGVSTMAVDRTGQIVDLLVDGRVVRGDNGAWQFIDSGVRSMAVDPSGRIIDLLTDGRLYQRNEAGGPLWQMIASGVNAMSVAPDGSVYALTAGGELDRYAAGGGAKTVVDVNVSRFWIDQKQQLQVAHWASLSSDGTLSVVGDDRGDRLVVDVTYDSVSVEGFGITVGGTVLGSVDRRAVHSILIVGGAGNDTLGVEVKGLPSWVFDVYGHLDPTMWSTAVSAMAIPAILVGGAGSNTMYNHGYGTAAFVQPGTIQAFSDSDESATVSTPTGTTTISGKRYDSLVSGPGQNRQFQGGFWDKVMDYAPGVVATIVTTIITDGLADEIVGPTVFGSTTLAGAASAALASAASQGIIDLGTGSGFSLTSLGLSIVMGGVGGYLQPAGSFPYNDFSLSGTYVGTDPWDVGLLSSQEIASGLAGPSPWLQALQDLGTSTGFGSGATLALNGETVQGLVDLGIKFTGATFDALGMDTAKMMTGISGIMSTGVALANNFNMTKLVINQWSTLGTVVGWADSQGWKCAGALIGGSAAGSEVVLLFMTDTGALVPLEVVNAGTDLLLSFSDFEKYCLPASVPGTPLPAPVPVPAPAPTPVP